MEEFRKFITLLVLKIHRKFDKEPGILNNYEHQLTQLQKWLKKFQIFLLHPTLISSFGSMCLFLSISRNRKKKNERF